MFGSRLLIQYSPVPGSDGRGLKNVISVFFSTALVVSFTSGTLFIRGRSIDNAEQKDMMEIGQIVRVEASCDHLLTGCRYLVLYCFATFELSASSPLQFSPPLRESLHTPSLPTSFFVLVFTLFLALLAVPTHVL